MQRTQRKQKRNRISLCLLIQIPICKYLYLSINKKSALFPHTFNHNYIPVRIPNQILEAKDISQRIVVTYPTLLN